MNIQEKFPSSREKRNVAGELTFVFRYSVQPYRRVVFELLWRDEQGMVARVNTENTSFAT